MVIATVRLNIVANPATMRDVFGGVAVVKEVWRQGWKIAEVRIVVTPQEDAALPGERMLAEHCRRASGKAMGEEMVKMLKGGIFEHLEVEVENWGIVWVRASYPGWRGGLRAGWWSRRGA